MEKMVLRELEVQLENLYEAFVKNLYVLLYTLGSTWTYWPGWTPWYSRLTSEFHNANVAGHTVHSTCPLRELLAQLVHKGHQGHPVNLEQQDKVVVMEKKVIEENKVYRAYREIRVTKETLVQRCIQIPNFSFNK